MPLLELAQNNPRIGFAESCGRVIREIVVSFQERIAELDPASTLRLRIEPTHADRPNKYTPVATPSKLIVASGDIRWGFDIDCGETVTWICGRMVLTHKDGATMRLAEAIVSAIRRCLGGGESVEPAPGPTGSPPAASRSEALTRIQSSKIFDAL